MRCRLPVLALMMHLVFAGTGRSVEDIPPKIQSLIDRIQKTRERDMDNLKEELAEKESELKTRDRSRTKEQTKKMAADVKAIKDKLDGVRKGDTIILPQLNLLSTRVGAIGAIPEEITLEISQVINMETMLVIPSTLESELAAGGTFSAKGLNRAAQTLHKKSGEPLMFRKFPTDGLADGKAFRTAKAVEVVGTESYTTVLGAKKTVFVVEPFDLEKWMPVIKDALKSPVSGKKGR